MRTLGVAIICFVFFVWVFIFFSLVSFAVFCRDYSIIAAVPVSLFLFCFLGLPYSTHHHQNSWWSLSFISLLISYPCSFYFDAFMLLARWEWKLPPLNEPGKNYKLSTNFVKILTFCPARRFDFFLFLGLTTPVIIPVMGISWPGSFGKVYFGMLYGRRGV